MDIKEKLHKPQFIGKEELVKDIAERFTENDEPDAYLIVENDKLIGILTDTDIVMKYDENKNKNVKVKDIMSTDVKTITADKTILEAIDFMTENAIEKLPVIENGKIIGILYGEEFMDIEQEKWKNLIFNQTVEEVYNILKDDPEIEYEELYEKIVKMDSFKKIEEKIQFDLYLYQQGLVLVSYSHIKKNKDKKLDEIKKEIKDRYLQLLNKYTQE